jgi:RNA polymerase sigma-70 factor, ECF subfamily
MSSQSLALPSFWRAPPQSVGNTSLPLSKSIAAALLPSFERGKEKGRDRELLGRIAQGDVAALRVLYDEQAPRALSIARRILRSVEEAEDVVQETFLELWRRAPQFDGRKGGAVAWVITIARSRAIDRLRAAGTAGRAIEGVGTSPDAHPTVPLSPAEHTERRSTESRVADALAALPKEQRQAIELAYFDGLSQTEIATKTETPLGTVKMRVKLAISKLAAILKDDLS